PIRRFPYVDLTKSVAGIRGLGVPNAIYGYWQVRRALIEIIGGFDIIHGHIACPMAVYAMTVAQAFGKPAICKIAGSGSDWDLAVLRSTSMLGSKLARHALKHMNMWIAMSGEIRRQLLECGVEPARIRSIPNGVGVPNMKPKDGGAPARRFLYLGRLSRTANRDCETVLIGFNEVARTHPDCELAFVGGGERESQLRQLLESLPHARPRTRFVGFADPEPWMEWADVVVQPSRAEGMSNTLLEAMAAGICCIANDIPANREVLASGEVGILVPVGSVDELAAAMTRVVEVSGECAKWAVRGRQRVVEVYSIDHVADEYLRLYSDLMRTPVCRT
ncbi:MAG: glycosyltransferase family 4 protein, partial [Holophaga sp.]